MEDTETGQFYMYYGEAYSISLALELIAATPDRPVHTVNVQDTARILCLEKPYEEYLAAGHIPMYRGQVDEEYARTCDLSVPVIMATLAPHGTRGSRLLIDGTHRVRRAYLDGVARLPCYLLTEEEAERIHVGDSRPRRTGRPARD